jgi:hypothetical protein
MEALSTMKCIHIIATAAILTLTACDDVASGIGPNTSARGSLTPTDGSLVVRVHRDGYQLGGDDAMIPASELEARLRSALPATSKKINVRLFPEIAPYHAVIAINAAAKVGFTEATGISNYSDDASEKAQELWIMHPAHDLTLMAARMHESVDEIHTSTN